MFLSEAPARFLTSLSRVPLARPSRADITSIDSGNTTVDSSNLRGFNDTSAGYADQHLQPAVQRDLLAPMERRGSEPTSATNDGADARPFAPSEDTAKQRSRPRSNRGVNSGSSTSPARLDRAFDVDFPIYCGLPAGADLQNLRFKVDLLEFVDLGATGPTPIISVRSKTAEDQKYLSSLANSDWP